MGYNAMRYVLRCMMWCDVWRHQMTRCGRMRWDGIRYDVIGCDVILCDRMWCDRMLCDIMRCYRIWFNMMWCERVVCDVIEYNMMGCDVIVRDVICGDLIWPNRMWYDMLRCDRIGWLCSRGDVNFALNYNCTVMKYHTDWVVVVYNTDPQSPLCTGSTSFSTETCTFLSPIGVLWNTGLVHRGICEMGLFTRDYLKLSYWTWSHHYLPKHLIQDYIS